MVSIFARARRALASGAMKNPARSIGKSVRIGITLRAADFNLPLHSFYERGNPFVSGLKRPFLNGPRAPEKLHFNKRGVGRKSFDLMGLALNSSNARLVVALGQPLFLAFEKSLRSVTNSCLLRHENRAGSNERHGQVLGDRRLASIA
jgi:hypothetical protein